MRARFRPITTALIAVVASLGIAGCKSKGELVLDQGVGVTTVRSRCPAVGVPNYTGDVTTFRTPGSKTADNIDVVATLTNLRTDCSETQDKVHATARFDVLARRTDTRGARQVQLPYFVTVLRGESAVVSKRIGSVTISFADGQERAQVSGQGSAIIDRAAATLPEDIRDRITRKRQAGDEDAAIDPLADPEVQAAIARASFELLVGFQLDESQLAYNATR